MPLSPLPSTALARRCDSCLPFDTTAELEDLPSVVGQERALQAVRFAVDLRAPGYHAYVSGPPGSGRHTAIRALLTARATQEPAPSDYAYVHDFAAPDRPRALQLDAGRADGLRRDMDAFIADLKVAIPAALDSDDTRARREALEAEAKARVEAAFHQLQEEARQRGVALVRTPMGVGLAPLKDGEPMPPEAFNALPEAEQERYRGELSQIHEGVQALMRLFPRWEQEHRSRVRALLEEVVTFTVQQPFTALMVAWSAHDEVRGWLESVRQDIITNTELFVHPQAAENGHRSPLGEGPSPFTRYQINVIVDHSKSSGAPVIYEDNPSHGNLFGRIEHRAVLGALLTDFNLLRAGALHRANGGYLILDITKVLTQPFVWEELKRTLRSNLLRMEPPGQSLSLISTVSLEPEPIPLQVKVVLLGDRTLHHMLSTLDPEFDALFKVQADFEDQVVWDDTNALLYSRMLATMGRQENMLPIGRDAVARVLETASRIAEDQRMISVNLRPMVDLIREADWFARKSGASHVGASHVQTALDARVQRADRVRGQIYDRIRQGVIRIATTGAAIGQVNGLSVLEVGGFRFGQPSRISARARLGRGQVVSIDREARLGGPIHTKGLLILQGFLAATYVPDDPLSLSATLVFEQSYGGVEGDSASTAELCTLLSAIAEVPLLQSRALTGAVDQHGQVQAIGGVNEKIEGFFDVCLATGGLTGEQGVLIPASNVGHLMLRRDVVAAVEQGRFHVWAIQTVDEALSLLTELEPGRREVDGAWTPGSLHSRVEEKLKRWSMIARKPEDK